MKRAFAASFFDKPLRDSAEKLDLCCWVTNRQRNNPLLRMFKKKMLKYFSNIDQMLSKQQ